jgi:Mg2+/Co2+ transporter CorB
VLTRFARLFRPRTTTSDGAHGDIMDAITTGHSAGGVETEHRNRLLGALDLHQRTVEEIMRHRREIEMIDADDSPDEVVAQVLASRYTRLPVFRDGTENILGVLHAKDLLREVHRLLRGEAGSIAGLDVARVAMKPYFIPETTSLDDQMREFLQRRTHFALVVDEYGGLQGLITLEDILEEIVGEIRDEFDKGEREPQLLPGPAGDYLIDGAMTIRDLNRAMDWALPDDEANTLAGLVIHESQTIPNEGQVFRFHGFRFEVVERRENRLTRLRIKPLQA